MMAAFCRFLLRLWGFKVKGDFAFNEPNVKSVLAVTPHTHWKDFPLGILVRTGYHLRAKFLAKSELFKPAYGWLFKLLGGYPVVRSKRTKFVDSVIEIFNEKEGFSITVAPEGTRKKVKRLKSGYYWIARGAGAVIVPTIFDFGNKEVLFLEPFHPTDDAKRDLEELDKLLCGYEGYVPEYSYECR